MRRRQVGQLVAVFAVITAAGIALGLNIHWFPAAADSQASNTDRLYRVLVVVSVPIFAIVATVILFAVLRFRARPGDELRDGPPIHGNTRLEILWTAFPAVLLISLCSYAFVVLRQNEKTPSGPVLDVHVQAQQFTWTFQYLRPGGGQFSTTQLYLPVNRPVYFSIDSRDVIHAFWVPAFRLQESAVPGVTTHLRATPTRIGSYEIVCTQLCGIGHSTMRSVVHVLSQADYNTWFSSASKPAATSTAGGATSTAGGRGAAGAGAGAGSATTPGAAALGKQVFVSASAGCGACHTIAAAGTSGTVGPALDRYLKGKSASYIRTQIVKPDTYPVPGFPAGVMPRDFGTRLTPAQLDALVSYLVEVSGGKP